MKQITPKKVSELDKMTEHEKDCEELYIKTVEQKNRVEKIAELNKNIEMVNVRAKKDLKKIDFMIEEKKLIGKYGTDITVLNKMDEYKDLLKKMTHFEISELLDKSNEILEKAKNFESTQKDSIEDCAAELVLIETRMKELEENGAKLNRDVPHGSFLKVESE